MSNEVSTEVKSLKELVAEKIRKEYVDLIPKEMWQEMVKAEIDAFTKDTKNRYDQIQEAPLKKVIRAELAALAQEAVDATLRQEGWADEYKDGQLVAGALIKKIVEENAETLISAFFGQMISGAVRQTMNNLTINNNNW